MTTSTSRRGFASLTPERRKEIASMGGKAAHAGGNAHQFDSAEGRAAGQKRHANATARASAAIAKQFSGCSDGGVREGTNRTTSGAIGQP